MKLLLNSVLLFILLTHQLNAQRVAGEPIFITTYDGDFSKNTKSNDTVFSVQLFVDELYLLSNSDKYRWLKSLTIKSRNWGDSLDVLPEALFSFDSLTHLCLEGLHIRKWDLLYTRMAAIPHLESLSLSGCWGNYLHPQIAALQNLASLSISLCHEDTDSPLGIIYSLGNLRRLELSFLSIEKLPEGISALTKLESVTISFSILHKLPSDFRYLHELRYLDLSRNKLHDFPDCLLTLRNLKYLDLSRNRISRLPDSIYQLNYLGHLDLAWNQLAELPDCIAQFDSLNYLDISMNRFRTVPTALLACDLLERLYCWGSQLNTSSPVLRLLSYSAAARHIAFGDTVNLYKDSFPEWNRFFGTNETVQPRGRFSQDVLTGRWCTYYATPHIAAMLFARDEIVLWELSRWRERKNPIYQVAQSAEVSMDFPVLPFGARRLTNIEELTIESYERWTPTWKFLGPIARRSEKIRALKIEDEYMRRLPRSVRKMKALETLELDCRSLIGLPEWLNDMPRLRQLKIREDVDIPDSIKSNRRITISYY